MSEKKLKIAMFGHKHVLGREGGVEIVVNELATRLSALGHSVTCYDRNIPYVNGEENKNVQEYNGVSIQPVWTIKRKGIAAMTASFSAAWKAAWNDYDIVHIHAEGPAAMSWLPKMRGKKVVVTIHGLDWARAKWGGFATKYIKWGEKQAVKFADEIIVLSKGVQDYFKVTYNRDTTFIPNGVSRPQLQKAEMIDEMWGLKKDSYVLFLGRIVPEKGLSYLLEAWKDIVTDKKLVIAGGSSDTETFLNELKLIAGENVVFTGFQEGRVLEELYSNAYIYILPSDLEGMPLSLLEAMSFGNCCLVSDIQECTEVVEDKAAVFKQSDVGELKEALQLLLNNPELVARYKAGAADFICTKYNWNDVVAETLRIYKR